MSSQTSFLTFYRDSAQANLYRIDIHDLDNTSQEQYVVKRFSYESDIEADEGSLLVQENTVLIAPHNKQLNLVGGVWYLNDYVSTTPVISSSARNVDNPPDFPLFSDSLRENEFAVVTINILSNGQIAGTLSFNFNGQTFSVPVNPSTLSASDIVRSIYTALNESPQRDVFTFSYDSSNVTATAIRPGPISFTGVAIGSTLGTGLTITLVNAETPEFYGGGDGTIIPRLQANTDHVYTARYVYRDRHKTKTAFPVYIETTTNRRFNAINITCTEDLDDGYADIEVFRKIGTSEFFLIDTIHNPVPVDGVVEYVDDGKTNQYLLDEKEYVWTLEHQTQATLRDRYIRANVSYSPRDLDVSGVVDVKEATLNSGDDTVPANCAVTLYVRKRQNDGLLTLHDNVGSVKVDEGDVGLYFKQNATILDAKEVAVYGKYTGLDPVEFISFNTPEIYNVNVPSIASHDEDVKDTPANPHILLGWRYLTARVIDGDVWFFAYDAGWDTSPSENDSPTKDLFGAGRIVGTTTFPATYDISIFGTPLTYIKKYVDIAGSVQTVVYEMAIYDGLSEAITQGKVSLRLDLVPFGFGGGLSTEAKNDEFIGVTLPVVGITDTSQEGIRVLGGSSNPQYPYSPKNSRVYLLLATDSVFSKFDNASLIRYTTFKRDLDAGGSTTINLATPILTLQTYFNFTILGVIGELSSELVSSSPGVNGYATQSNPYFLYDRSGDASGDALIYLGKLPNDTTVQGPLRTGYEKTIENNFVSYRLKDSNIYETLITSNDVETLQRDYPCQIIWSDPYVVGTDNSGNRTFQFTNFLNIQRDYGSIIAIEPMLNKLVVFCQRGVAVVLVGEILTQTVGGETIVSAVNFLNSPTWILRNVKPVHPKSIKQYEGMLYFSDGQDVWMFGEQLQNISQGAVTLAGPQVGAIDPVNKEYRISGGGKTYSYSTEIREWTGPHTYEDQSSETNNDSMISVLDSNLVQHNTGNKYADVDYDTVVESVANDLVEASVDKTYRKFYIDVQGDTTFSYGKDYDDMTDKDLAGAATKQGLYHVGVNPSDSTARQIYWRLTSSAEDFILKLITFLWNPRTRR